MLGGFRCLNVLYFGLAPPTVHEHMMELLKFFRCLDVKMFECLNVLAPWSLSAGCA